MITDIRNLIQHFATDASIVIQDREITDSEAQQLAAALKSNSILKSFSFNNIVIGNNGFEFIIKGLTEKNHLSTVDFSFTDLKDKTNYLAKFLENTAAKIKVITLKNTNIDNSNIKYFAKALKNNEELEKFTLTNNNFCDNAIKLIIDALLFIKKQNAASKVFNLIDLSHNNIKSTGSHTAQENIKKLADLAKITKALDLSYNKLGENITKRTVSLANLLANNTVLENLNLSHNMIEFNSSIALADELKINEKLSIFDLSGNKILVLGNSYIRHWKQALEHNIGLKKLNLAFNQIDAEKVRFIIEAIPKNKALLELDLQDNDIGKDAADNLIKAAKKNYYLTILKLKEHYLNERNALELAKHLQENNLLFNLKEAVTQKDNAQVEKLLMNQPEIPNELKFELLFQALKSGNLNISTSLLAYGSDINLINMEKMTLLHYALTEKWPIESISFMLENNANPQKRNNDNDTPIEAAIKDFTYSSTEWKKMFYRESLQSLLQGTNDTEFLYKMERKLDKIKTNRDEFNKYSVPQILARETKASSNCKAVLAKKGLEKGYTILFRRQAIKPLLEIAKYAALGLHSLSTNSSSKRNKLQIFIDPDSADVNKATLERVKDAYGVYNAHDNKIKIGGYREDNLSRSTLIHEITHFVANEVYKNNSKPYYNGDTENQQRFTEICNELYSRKNLLHERLRSVFIYELKDRHAELIVRIPQLLEMCGDDRILIRECPELYSYYKNVFIKSCNDHLAALREKHDIRDDIVYRSYFLDKQNKTDDKSNGLTIGLIRHGVFKSTESITKEIKNSFNLNQLINSEDCKHQRGYG